MSHWILRSAVLVVVSCVWIRPAQSADKILPPLAKMELTDGDTVVFLGDSITHQCLYTQYVEDFFYTRFPNKQIRFHNAGVGGARAWDALARFDRDVASYRPKYVTVLLGMNDGRYQPYNEDIFRTYHRDMQLLIQRIEQTNAIPVLMTPTMFDSRAARLKSRKQPPEKLELYNSVLAYYGTWLREVAVEHGFGFVDMYGPLNQITLQRRKAQADFTLIPDAVHPGASGQLVMAYAVIDDLGLRAPLSNIRIVRGAAAQEPTENVKGGQLSGLSFTDAGVEFTWQATGLPWVVPEAAQQGSKLLKLGHRASREALEIHGLKPGVYQLSIDGQTVGKFDAVALARHVELQSLTTTPQYQQAQAVVDMNAARNAGPVRSLRNEWRLFQRFARLQAQAKQAPDDQKLATQVQELAKRLEGIDQRIEQHETEAHKLDTEIRKTAQPKSRRYVLRRLAAAK
ncbi:MAG: SGNH/GDSL hydrolase family protein [Planctomycetaceae bacterium]